MNTSHLKYIISVLGITTGIFAFGNLKANASEGQDVHKNISAVNTVTTQQQAQTTTPVVISGTNISQNAADLQAQTITPQTPIEPQQTPSPSLGQVPAPSLSPGRETRGGSSYIGVGGNIGLGGDTRLSEGSFSVISKIGLTNNFSIRPAALIGDNAVFLIPLTLDFPVESVTDTGVQQINVAPYIGGGAAISTGRDSTVGFLLSGGVDVPLSPQFTANAGVNVGFIDETEVGLMLGIGYNF
ncbi:hypothetical protein CEN50_13680 [Fischerella thermalis CCMEE 5268]|uniref:Outer membrane protein beta-barrel domain-containing protein n=1 Tax=Fischerella thermalis CCMEE 5268 TaxID=2019662 RepID=A0A2N6KFB0_9CYAN|nr:hypothetical protein [Fischerella thermalis]PLZ97797.1 hypothetical protein CEN50_13680 [Fischerella thermalis CCMEE 5268]